MATRERIKRMAPSKFLFYLRGSRVCARKIVIETVSFPAEIPQARRRQLGNLALSPIAPHFCINIVPPFAFGSFPLLSLRVVLSVDSLTSCCVRLSFDVALSLV